MTFAEIRRFRDLALEHRDAETAALADKALKGNREAAQACTRLVEAARYQLRAQFQRARP